MVNKNDLQRYITDKMEDISFLDVKEREVALHPSTEFISAIYGPRRAGKTYLFYSFLKKNEQKDIMYLNFDDIQLRDWTSDDLIDSISLFNEITGREPVFIFMDEVQNIEDWERAVRTIYEKKRFKILLTGSSSKFLAKEISTSLRGRSLSYPLLPLSFREYLDFIGADLSSIHGTKGMAQIRSKLDLYLSKGSFPGPIFEKGLIGRFYDDYLDLVIYRDLVERYGITNLGLMKFIIKSIIRSFSKELSVNRLYNDWRSMKYNASKGTLYEYFSYLEDAMFVLPLRKYSRSERTSDLSIPKVYLPDTGLPSFVCGYQRGRTMENCVFLELYRHIGKEPGFDLYFWRDRSMEVDLILCREDTPVELIQVTESLSGENRKRELGALEKVGDELGCNKRTVITWTGEEKVDEGVDIVPLWKFLLRAHDDK